MNSTLIISGREKGFTNLVELLKKALVTKIAYAKTADEARRLFIENEFDLCIVDTPVKDELFEILVQDIVSRGRSEVILLVDATLYDEISERVEDFGVITIAKPISKILMWNAIKLTQAAHKKYSLIQSENRRLLQKIEDIKIIDRAKCILISNLFMSEQEAHKYIEKQAMDMRITRREVAEEILKTYEN